MKVLQCHNFYQQPGGEDRVLAEEKALLESRGHTVRQYVLHNDAVAGHTKLRLLGRTLWSRESHHAVREIVAEFAPDVVHVHNTLPLMSPSIYSAARSGGAAVVQTLHNYRMVCPGAYCQRGGEPCELCLSKKIKWPAIKHACYRENRAATASIVAMLAVHGALGTYRRHIDLNITCSAFARDKMIEAGLDPQRVMTKPNFQLSDLGVGPGGGGYAVYLGRLSPEKGVQTMLDAWDHDDMTAPLHILGGGPMEADVREIAGRRPAVTCLGHASWDQVVTELQNAALLVFPSVTYEGHPMTLLESMQAGTPMVGSRLGAIPEIIDEGVTGRCVDANNPQALRDAVLDMFRDPERLAVMRRDVRKTYDTRYAPDQAYQRLLACYEQALMHRHQGPANAPRTATGNHAPANHHDTTPPANAQAMTPAVLGEKY